MDVSETEFTGFGASVARARITERPGAFFLQMDGYRALPRRGGHRVGAIVPTARDTPDSGPCGLIAGQRGCVPASPLTQATVAADQVNT